MMSSVSVQNSAKQAFRIFLEEANTDIGLPVDRNKWLDGQIQTTRKKCLDSGCLCHHTTDNRTCSQTWNRAQAEFALYETELRRQAFELATRRWMLHKVAVAQQRELTN